MTNNSHFLYFGLLVFVLRDKNSQNTDKSGVHEENDISADMIVTLLIIVLFYLSEYAPGGYEADLDYYIYIWSYEHFFVTTVELEGNACEIIF